MSFSRSDATTFLATVREEHGEDLPRYVEQELRRYVRCGILAHGFLRVACPSCRQGSVTFVQRFNATLGCFVHFHVIAPDGVFCRAQDGAITFVAGRAPSRDEIADVAGRVALRMMKWLRRRNTLDARPEEERSNEAPDVSPLEACMQLSLFGGTFLRPCRYGARPPFSLERLSLLADDPGKSLTRDGRVAYVLRKPRKNGATHLVMTPVQCLARIAAIIPPPRTRATSVAKRRLKTRVARRNKPARHLSSSRGMRPLSTRCDRQNRTRPTLTRRSAWPSRPRSAWATTPTLGLSSRCLRRAEARTVLTLAKPK